MRVRSAIGSAVVAITRTITVASGVFAPGHLGELTRVVPFELVDAVLEEDGGRERRLRHTLLQGRVLHSGDPAGLEQEMWVLLALYQALRIAITDAVTTIPGTEPRPGQLPDRRLSSRLRVTAGVMQIAQLS